MPAQICCTPSLISRVGIRLGDKARKCLLYQVRIRNGVYHIPNTRRNRKLVNLANPGSVVIFITTSFVWRKGKRVNYR